MLSTVLTRLWGDHNKKKTCGNRAPISIQFLPIKFGLSRSIFKANQRTSTMGSQCIVIRVSWHAGNKVQIRG